MADRAHQGLDESAIVALFERLERPIYNVVYRWLWNREEAAEVVQEAFLRLWRMRERVDLRTVEPLVYRIAVNAAASRRRRAQIWRSISLDAASVGPGADENAEDGLVREATRDEVRRAVEALPERLRRVVLLCEMTDLTLAQIGETLGIPPGTVASRRHRALRLLRARLESKGPR